jgi:FkbM family methyltransferase
MPSLLPRLATTLIAADHFGNPFRIALTRLLGKPENLMEVKDRVTGVHCICSLDSHHMFASTWYTRVYDVPGVPIRKGDVVVDIGANQGFFTCYAAQKGARVYAFEPVPELFERLRLNVQRNGFADRVTLEPYAVGGASGTAEMFVSSSLGGGQSTILPEFARNANVPISRRITVRCKTLPQILAEFSLRSVRLCKMDVEGAELQILRTLNYALLARIQSLVLEYHPEAYDLGALLRLTIGWGTHQVSYMDDRPYVGNILRVASNHVLRSLGAPALAMQAAGAS